MNSKRVVNILVLVFLVSFAVRSAYAQAPPPPLNPDNWQTSFGALGGAGGLGFVLGTGPGLTDDYEGAGESPVSILPNTPSLLTLAYYQNGVAPGSFPTWEGPTGFYSGDLMGPIAPGGSKTWCDIYMWAQDYTPSTPGQTSFGAISNWPVTPTGYTAEISLVHIPASANWTGPTDFWINLSQTDGQDVLITLPIATLSDPSQILTQATEMSITVYAPVPEPSSALPLVVGAIGMAGLALRRRR